MNPTDHAALHEYLAGIDDSSRFVSTDASSPRSSRFVAAHLDKASVCLEQARLCRSAGFPVIPLLYQTALSASLVVLRMHGFSVRAARGYVDDAAIRAAVLAAGPSQHERTLAELLLELYRRTYDVAPEPTSDEVDAVFAFAEAMLRRAAALRPNDARPCKSGGSR